STFGELGGVASPRRSRKARSRPSRLGCRGGTLARDPVGIAEELEVHRVLERVVAQPVEAEALERLDPAARQRRALVDGALILADRVGRPGGDAAAARVPAGVDVDGDAEQMVGDLDAAVRVGGAEPADGLGGVARAAGAGVRDVLLDG